MEPREQAKKTEEKVEGEAVEPVAEVREQAEETLAEVREQAMEPLAEVLGRVEKAYAAWPDRLYVVDNKGKIAYKSGKGPGGFKPLEMAAALRKICTN